MIVATNNCGCPRKPPDPPCSPCCSPGTKHNIPPPKPPQSPVNSCCSPPRPRPGCPPQKIEEPPQCCPTKPAGPLDFLRSRKIGSEIADRGLPYKEFEAIFNGNTVIIRTQTEPAKPEFDPPCDCIEDPLAQKIEETPRYDQNSGNRTVTLYPQTKTQEPQEEGDSKDKKQKEEVVAKPAKQLENPNMFLLRVKKNYNVGEKKYNIDLEFKTPRPWSDQKRLEYMDRK